MTRIELSVNNLQAPILVFGIITVLCWLSVLSGVGTGMEPWAMTTLEFTPNRGKPSMETIWSATYAARIFFMWYVMMLAMMLPGALLSAFTRPVEFGWRWFTLNEYAIVWLGFSLVATALQYMMECLNLLDGMYMWSVDKTMSVSILCLVAAFQLPKLFRFKASFLGGANRNSLSFGVSCLMSTGPVMGLLYVGGIMNLYWIAGLSIWATIEKYLPHSRIIPTFTIVTCLMLALLISL